MKAVLKQKCSLEPLSLAHTFAAEPGALAGALQELTLPGAEKFRIAKALLLLSERYPASLYPHFSDFQGLLDCENNILKWTAYQILANLAGVDVLGQIPPMLERYLKPISGPSMITAAHAMAGAAKMATAQTQLTGRVVRAILKVEKGRYQTPECRNVAIGHAIKALATLPEAVAKQPSVLRFMQRQTRNTRSSTRRKAEHFLKDATAL